MATNAAIKAEPSPESVNSKGISPISGTFIQPWLYNAFTEADWDKELTNWKLMGIEYVIMGDTASMDIQTLAISASYDCHIDGATMHTDVLTKLFEKCSQYGIKVYSGMGNTPEGWPYLDFENSGNVEKFKQVCERFALIAEDLYNTYYTAYPETFAGFYFVPELYNSSAFDNETLRTKYVNGLAAGVNVVLDKINSLNPALPFIFSPYVNLFGGSWVSKNYDNISAFWREFLSTAHFRDGDILCPQDSVGAGGADLTVLDSITKAYYNAIKNCGKNIVFYSNCEIFVQPTGDFFGESHFTTWGSASIDRVVEQFKTVSKYVDRIFTFAYSHYLSEINNVSGYYNSYMYYLEHGELEKEAPTAPDKFRTNYITIDGTRCLTVYWSGMYDNFGIHKVNIYKNGEFLTYRLCSRMDGSANRKPAYPNNFYDLDFTEDTSEAAVYEFEVIDCSGNVSSRASFTVEPGSIPNNVRLDKAYTGPIESLPDESSAEPEESSKAAESSEASALESSTQTDDKGGLSTGAIIGIGAACAAVVAAAVAIVLGRKKKK